ncbi:MAG: topoisomerase C-terminal repeat-containing protein, partial [Clostridia bacterium]|nr:topoisomerase C-terminal repeat-containing protein [Clostridia bacterium]
YRGSMTVDESVMLAKNEIAEVFGRKETSVELDTDTGFYGDLVGKCPVCGKDVVKGKYSYGCTGYKEGCKFRINSFICKRNISLSNAKLLLENGKTSEIQGFISKAGKPFNARLKLDGDKVVFDF